MTERKRVLTTGGAGYIGSHVVVELMAAGFDAIILDNFENAAADVPQRIECITGRAVPVVRGDVRDRALVAETLGRFEIDAVIHLAGKKAVGESVAEPLRYFDANVGGATILLDTMRELGTPHLIFSSSATVYGLVDRIPIDEMAPVKPTNPYGRSKLMIEEIITDTLAAGALSGGISLRYFNPVGAHHSGIIGEEPNGVPNNLFPFIAQTAAGWRDSVRVFGDDYDTPDGTGVRDYIHVVDLARGHVAALRYVLEGRADGTHLRINLGTGRGHSVLETLHAFSAACGFEIPREICPRRPGDVAACVADPSRAAALLGWQAELSLERMCADHWAFQSGLAGRRKG